MAQFFNFVTLCETTSFFEYTAPEFDYYSLSKEIQKEWGKYSYKVTR